MEEGATLPSAIPDLKAFANLLLKCRGGPFPEHSGCAKLQFVVLTDRQLFSPLWIDWWLSSSPWWLIMYRYPCTRFARTVHQSIKCGWITLLPVLWVNPFLEMHSAEIKVTYFLVNMEGQCVRRWTGWPLWNWWDWSSISRKLIAFGYHRQLMKDREQLCYRRTFLFFVLV